MYIPVMFSYNIDDEGIISSLRHKPMYEKEGWGWSAFDTFMKSYTINPDKKSFNFTMELPEYCFDKPDRIVYREVK